MTLPSDRPAAETRKIATWGRQIVDEHGNAVHQPTTFANPDAESVGQIMTRTTYCVKPEVTVETAIGMLLELSVSGLPVVDDDGRPIGLVSKTDLLRHLHESGDGVEEVEQAGRRVDQVMGTGFHATGRHGTAVRDVMMPVVFAVDESASIACAAALMAGENIHRLPVLAPDGTVGGIVTTLDIARWVAARGGYAV